MVKTPCKRIRQRCMGSLPEAYWAFYVRSSDQSLRCSVTALLIRAGEPKHRQPRRALPLGVGLGVGFQLLLECGSYVVWIPYQQSSCPHKPVTPRRIIFAKTQSSTARVAVLHRPHVTWQREPKPTNSSSSAWVRRSCSLLKTCLHVHDDTTAHISLQGSC